MHRVRRYLKLLWIRATGDSLLWGLRQMRWEAALVVVTSLLAGWQRADPDASALRIGATSILWGFVSLAILWVLVWLYYLACAPAKLRKREVKRARSSVRVRARVRILGRDTVIADRARHLITPIQEFARVREMHLGRGELHDANVREHHRKALTAIEHFGAFVASSGPYDETLRGRSLAMRLYESIRGFGVHADAQMLVDRIYEYASPPETRVQRLRHGLEDQMRRLWYQVDD